MIYFDNPQNFAYPGDFWYWDPRFLPKNPMGWLDNGESLILYEKNLKNSTRPIEWSEWEYNLKNEVFNGQKYLYLMTAYWSLAPKL